MNNNNINIKGLKLDERVIDVLKKLQVQGDDGPVSLYVRTINDVVDRLLLDEDADPLQNLEQARALTLLKMDLLSINDAAGDNNDDF